MVTKSRKSHKIAIIIILITILYPAFAVTSVYPKVAEKCTKIKAQNYPYIEVTELEVESKFLNYAMEAGYYIYGSLQEQDTGVPMDLRVLKAYGWVRDYEKVSDEVIYKAVYKKEDGTELVKTNEEDGDKQSESKIEGTIQIHYDEHGAIQNVSMQNINLFDTAKSGVEIARKSVEQYRNNVKKYMEDYQVEIDEDYLLPKNFSITFFLNENTYFDDMVSAADIYYNERAFISAERIFFDWGVMWLVLAAACVVAVVAIVLPFIKKLNTGKEKLLSLPLEGTILLTIGGVALACFMAEAMTISCKADIAHLVILDYWIPDRTIWKGILVANFFGWALAFFLEYIVVSSIRQFFCGPKQYLKEKIFCVNLCRKMGRKIAKWAEKVTTLDVQKLHKWIVGIVGINFLILGGLLFVGFLFSQFFWSPVPMFFVVGIGLVVYSVLLFVLLSKAGTKLKSQHDSILKVTKEMSEGNFRVQLQEDLGVLQSLGDSLAEVQRGFEKAVVEEAKSQSMKTELITNVSHDLKTPLTAIITYVDLLKKEDLTEEERASYIQTLDLKSQRLKVLIEDLFEISKAQSGNVTMNFMEVDIVSLMKQVRSELSDELEKSSVLFRWNLPDDKICLLLDGQRTYRVFENLLNNIRKYAMPSSRAYVDILDGEERVEVVFRNISNAELPTDGEYLTERFVRGDASRNSEGSGLGLAIAKSFVELQNGTFKIEVDGDLFKVTISWRK